MSHWLDFFTQIKSVIGIYRHTKCKRILKTVNAGQLTNRQAEKQTEQITSSPGEDKYNQSWTNWKLNAKWYEMKNMHQF